MKTQCVLCNKPFSDLNVFTHNGWIETQITGMCETCFDGLFPDEDEPIHSGGETLTILDKAIRESTNSFNGRLTNKLNSDILDAVKKFNGNVFLGGGCWRASIDKSPIKDYDIFFKDISLVEDFEKVLLGLGYKKVFECPVGHLHTFKLEVLLGRNIHVQLITETEYNNTQSLIDTFDITACCCAWDGNSFSFHEMFHDDCESKTVKLNNVEYHVSTFKRMMKYKDKGYTIPDTTIEYYLDTVCAISGGDISKLNLRNYID